MLERNKDPYDANNPQNYTDDHVPWLDTPEELEPGTDHTFESREEYNARRRRLYEVEEGVLSENDLLANGVVFDNELAEENMENDNP